MVKKTTKEFGENGFPTGNSPVGQPGQVQQPPQDDVMEVLSNLQEAIAQLSMRMDKFENQPMENGEQEVPKMESKEEVHVGGNNEVGDLDDMDKKDKLNGATQPPENKLQEMMAKMEAFIKKLEDLRGVPEVPRGKKEQPIGPDATKSVPATKQPSVGDAPSGGGFDSDDKTAEDEAKEAESEVTTPKKDYKKPTITYNAAEIEKPDEEDPSIPKPGFTTKKPEPMDMKNPAEKLYHELMGEVRNESLSKRQSTIFTDVAPKKEREANEATNIVREYLQKNYPATFQRCCTPERYN